MDFSIHFGEWDNSGRKGEGPRWTVFPTPLNPFGKDPEEEKPSFDHTGPQKVPYETRWKQPRCCILGSIVKSAGSRIALQSWPTPQYQETALTV